MTDRSKESRDFADAVMARLDGLESRDRRRWLDRDARRALWAVGGLFTVVVLAAGVSWMISPPRSESPASSTVATPGVEDAFRRLSVDPADVPNSNRKPLENSDGSATPGDTGRYDSAVAAGPGQAT